MNTLLRKSLIALGAVAAISAGALSTASASQYIIGEGNAPAAGYGPNEGSTTSGFSGGANLALPFAAPVQRSANNCFDVIGAPGRYSADEVASCRAETGLH